MINQQFSTTSLGELHWAARQRSQWLLVARSIRQASSHQQCYLSCYLFHMVVYLFTMQAMWLQRLTHTNIPEVKRISADLDQQGGWEVWAFRQLCSLSCDTNWCMVQQPVIGKWLVLEHGILCWWSWSIGGQGPLQKSGKTIKNLWIWQV